jgi:uncharacterized Zn finger protein
MQYTEDMILAKCPDEASKKASRDHSNPKKWLCFFADERAVWGEIKGSGKEPYKVQIDLKDSGSKCSCPSKKQPCKHQIGLFLCYVKNQGSFKLSEQPEVIKEWLNKRDQREAKKGEPKKPIDEVAQAKRAASREKKVSDGILELQLWLKDTIRSGLLDARNKKYEYFDKMRASMIDSQAKGLANRVIELSSTNENLWEETLLKKLSQLYSICLAYTNIQALPEKFQEDIKTLIGWDQSKDQILSQESIKDQWVVLGYEKENNENLTTHRHWLFGSNTNRYALLLSYQAFSQSSPDYTFLAGSVIDADLCFYPSAYPLRALVKENRGNINQTSYTGLESLSVLENQYSTILSVHPFVDRFPVIVKNLVPLKDGSHWILMDEKGKYGYIENSFNKKFELLSVSGGKPLDLSLLFDSYRLFPLGYWQNGEYIAL